MYVVALLSKSNSVSNETKINSFCVISISSGNDQFLLRQQKEQKWMSCQSTSSSRNSKVSYQLRERIKSAVLFSYSPLVLIKLTNAAVFLSFSFLRIL
jgi:hypothetical protein